ncbi:MULTISPECIES: hypothetical protein [unclassified Microbacterium]|uniref:hypothetical protein n=1 Tax=unclassified Microbacterium TaxID=2609290 RepID=UPI00342FC0C7
MPNWGALVPFVRDWVVVATVPVWVPLGIVKLAGQAVTDLRLPLAAALFAYALALAAAFLDDFSPDTSVVRGQGALRGAAQAIKWITVIIASAAIALLSLQDLAGATPALAMSSGDTLVVAFTLAATCFLLSVFVVLFGESRSTRGLKRSES